MYEQFHKLQYVSLSIYIKNCLWDIYILHVYPETQEGILVECKILRTSWLNEENIYKFIDLDLINMYSFITLLCRIICYGVPGWHCILSQDLHG
jgi:hypothetical protein